MNDIDEWPELQMSSIKHKFKTKKWTLAGLSLQKER